MPARKKTNTKSSSSSVKKTSTKTKPVEEVVEEEVVEETTEEVVEDAPKKKRFIPTRDTVLESFDELVEFIANEIDSIRESPNNKASGVKFLRSVNKRVKTIRSHSARVMKKKRAPSTTTPNKNSGFLKEVPISKELATFAEWDPKELRSRVDVTRFVCSYIKENDLQNPENGREINPDKKLTKLLKFNAKEADGPLTYPTMQKYLKHHFPKPAVATATTTATATATTAVKGKSKK